jgi:hypothetical protein
LAVLGPTAVLRSWLQSAATLHEKEAYEKDSVCLELTLLLQLAWIFSRPNSGSAIVGHQYKYQRLTDGPGSKLPEQHIQQHRLYGHAVTALRERSGEGGK